MYSASGFQKLFFFHFFLILLVPIISFSQNETIVSSEIRKVTVFLKGAQVTRTKRLDVNPGKSTLRFSDLSPYIDPASVQVKATGDLMVLSVNHQTNFLDSLQRSKELQDLQRRKKELQDKMKVEGVNMAVIDEELAFLEENRNIGGRNEEVKLLNLKTTADYYRERNATLRMKKMTINTLVTDLNQQYENLVKEIRQLTSVKALHKGEIVVKVSSKQATSCLFELTYLVENAGWYPTYDVRSNEINAPLQIYYKANVHQDTREDWKEVGLTLSSSDPHKGLVVPVLQTYYLDYNTAPPSYTQSSGGVSGIVLDAKTREPLVGAVIYIPGTTIATTADVAGKYQLTLPANTHSILISYAGYKELTQQITGSYVVSNMEEDISGLEEVVVSGYSAEGIQGRAAGINTNDELKLKYSNVKKSSLEIPIEQVESRTSFEFQINIPYTVPSNNKNIVVDMETYQIPASYEYHSVPKIDQEAFLVATATDWQKINLLEGEANIFYDGTYIGKSLLDPRNMSDTLTLPLGRDKGVLIKREKVGDFTTKKFIGTKKEESRAWKISVKNNRKQPIHLRLSEQVPVSTLEEIEVSIDEISGAQLDKETGEVKWMLDIAPGAVRELILKYKVKYPKNRKLIIE